MEAVVVAVDGPSGSGKSSTARGVATALGLRYLDTGAMYRALTWAVLQRGVDPADADAVAEVARTLDLASGTAPQDPTITADGADVSGPIRGPEVTAAVSAVSAVPGVRAEMVRRQRALIGAGGIVVEGRDIGSVVAPGATVKVFLTADPTARATRRAAQVGAPTSAHQATLEDLDRRDGLDSGRAASPLARAPDAVDVDTTDLTLPQAVQRIVALVRTAAGAPEPAGPEPVARGPVPVLAVVGRPNVGKSTLVNRILGRREAVVEDVPGVTRDRATYDVTWNGQTFTVVDTGGWDPGARGLSERITQQAEVAAAAADAVLFVVDATVGAVDADEAVVRVLRRSGRPIVLAANKVDDQRGESEAATLWNLGLGEPHPVSALHGRGSGDLLDAVLTALPEGPAEVGERPAGPRRVAIVGRPNVGKSSLLNVLAGEERVVVHEVDGTTVDPVDELIVLGGRQWRFVDTAGVRRRVREASGHEYYASLRTRSALERAEVAVVVIDAGQPLSEQDQRLIGTVADSGRAVVVAFNKWDLVDGDRRGVLGREIERDLARVQWAPRVNVAARTGWHVDRLVPALDRALAGWQTRVPTAGLNTFLGRLVAEHPHPVRSGKQPRVLFATQAGTAPPTLVLFTTGRLEPAYLRFIERRLRRDFGFVGTPIHLRQRVRDRRRR